MNNHKSASHSRLSRLVPMAVGAALAGVAGLVAAVFSDPQKRQAAHKAATNLRRQADKSVNSVLAKTRKAAKKS